jgi:hypothetical protein
MERNDAYDNDEETDFRAWLTHKPSHDDWRLLVPPTEAPLNPLPCWHEEGRAEGVASHAGAEPPSQSYQLRSSWPNILDALTGSRSSEQRSRSGKPSNKILSGSVKSAVKMRACRSKMPTGQRASGSARPGKRAVRTLGEIQFSTRYGGLSTPCREQEENRSGRMAL